MKRWLGFFAIVALAGVPAIGYLRWLQLPEQRFKRVQLGTRLDEVRAIMGRDENHYTTRPHPCEQTVSRDVRCAQAIWMESSEEGFLVDLNADGRVLSKGVIRPDPPSMRQP